MVRKFALTLSLTAGCVWCLALATDADGSFTTMIEDGFKPVASVESLMHGQGKFWKEITEWLQKPASEHRSAELVESAEVLAELANVNRFNKDKEDYRAWATKLRDTAMAFAAEAKKKEVDETALRTLRATMKNACADCHDMYQ